MMFNWDFQLLVSVELLIVSLVEMVMLYSPLRTSFLGFVTIPFRVSSLFMHLLRNTYPFPHETANQFATVSQAVVNHSGNYHWRHLNCSRNYTYYSASLLSFKQLHNQSVSVAYTIYISSFKKLIQFFSFSYNMNVHWTLKL